MTKNIGQLTTGHTEVLGRCQFYHHLPSCPGTAPSSAAEPSSGSGAQSPRAPVGGRGPPVATAAVHCGACSAGPAAGGWARTPQSQRGHLSRARGFGLCCPHPWPSPGLMAPRPLSPLVLALGGAAAVLGSVLFILWKAYFGRGRERRWDRGEAWWGAEPARLPEWDEWDVSAGPGSGPPHVQPGVWRPARAEAPGSGPWRRSPQAPCERARGWQRGIRESQNRGLGGPFRGCEAPPCAAASLGLHRERPSSQGAAPKRCRARALPAPAQCARLGRAARGRRPLL